MCPPVRFALKHLTHLMDSSFNSGIYSVEKCRWANPRGHKQQQHLTFVHMIYDRSRLHTSLFITVNVLLYTACDFSGITLNWLICFFTESWFTARWTCQNSNIKIRRSDSWKLKKIIRVSQECFSERCSSFQLPRRSATPSPSDTPLTSTITVSRMKNPRRRIETG